MALAGKIQALHGSAVEKICLNVDMVARFPVQMQAVTIGGARPGSECAVPSPFRLSRELVLDLLEISVIIDCLSAIRDIAAIAETDIPLPTKCSFRLIARLTLALVNASCLIAKNTLLNDKNDKYLTNTKNKCKNDKR